MKENSSVEDKTKKFTWINLTLLNLTESLATLINVFHVESWATPQWFPLCCSPILNQDALSRTQVQVKVWLSKGSVWTKVLNKPVKIIDIALKTNIYLNNLTLLDLTYSMSKIELRLSGAACVACQ